MEEPIPRLPSSKRGEKRRREKGKAKAIDQSAVVRVTLPRRFSAEPSLHHPVNGTKQVAHPSSRRASRVSKAQSQSHSDVTPTSSGRSDHFADQPGQSSSSAWACVPVARAEISRLPPLWSSDGRSVALRTINLRLMIPQLLLHGQQYVDPCQLLHFTEFRPLVYAFLRQQPRPPATHYISSPVAHQSSSTFVWL